MDFVERRQLACVDIIEHGGAAISALCTKKMGLVDYVEASLRVRSVPELYQLCGDIQNHFGFNLTTLALLIPSADGNPQLYFLSDNECAWIDHYKKNNFMLKDPFVRHCANRTTPYVWTHTDRDMDMTDDERRVLQDSRDFGAKNIISIPCHGTRGDKGKLRLSTFGNEVLDKQHVAYVLPQITMLSRYLHEALCNIAMKSRGDAFSVKLTPREQEVLSWVAQGKDSWMIGEILKISENTVLTHMKRIHQKLGVSNRQHAVAKALTMKLICM